MTHIVSLLQRKFVQVKIQNRAVCIAIDFKLEDIVFDI